MPSQCGHQHTRTRAHYSEETGSKYSANTAPVRIPWPRAGSTHAAQTAGRVWPFTDTATFGITSLGWRVTGRLVTDFNTWHQEWSGRQVCTSTVPTHLHMYVCIHISRDQTQEHTHDGNTAALGKAYSRSTYCYLTWTRVAYMATPSPPSPALRSPPTPTRPALRSPPTPTRPNYPTQAPPRCATTTNTACPW